MRSREVAMLQRCIKLGGDVARAFEVVSEILQQRLHGRFLKKIYIGYSKNGTSPQNTLPLYKNNHISVQIHFVSLEAKGS